MDPKQVSDLFQDAVQITSDEITFSLNPGEVDEPQETNQVIIGKILSRYKLGKAAIQGSLRLSWSAIKRWKWKEIEDGLIKFTFANRNDAMNVLARRPWFVCGSLMVLMPWPSWLTPSEIRFDKTPMWVRIESIPPFYWNLSNLQELASRASPVHELPQGIEDAIGMSNLKFRATINLNKPVFSGEIAPFGNNSKTVSISDLQELKEATSESTGGRPNRNTSSASNTDKREARQMSPKGSSVQKETPHEFPNSGKQEIAVGDSSQTNSLLEEKRAPSNTTISPGFGSNKPKNKQESPCTKPTPPPIPYSSSILGSQAHIMEWPSKECCAQTKARELFKDGLTVDKFFREPTLFNPLLGIDDFRVYEHLQGPRKRKAMDGILFNASPEAKISTSTISDFNPSQHQGSNLIPTPDEHKPLSPNE
uniref:DUF4283 domain-containing protein n=1 Tax=Cannabis sativa TaxID=3483 RepID=A0A803QHN0_CANSA